MKKKYEAIAGKHFSYPQYKVFDEEKWLSLFRFFELFLVPIKKSDGTDSETIKVNQVKLDEQEETEFAEFYYRVNRNDDYKSGNKLNSLMNNTLIFLKKNPGVVTEQMRAFLTIRHPALAWALKQFDSEVTPAGEIVVRNEEGLQNATNPTMRSLEARQLTVQIKVTDIMEKVADSISSHDYRSMTGSEKIKALKDLSFTFGFNAKKLSGNSFTQVNINSANVKDLEKIALEAIEKK